MPRYRYFFFDHEGLLKATDDGSQVTDFAAMDHATDLLAQAREFAAVQIWRGETFVTGLARQMDAGNLRFG